jgi:hypothetical protein
LKKRKRKVITSICHGCDEEFTGKRDFCTPECRKELACRQKGASGFLNKVVAPHFQKMIRAEAGADPRQYVVAMVEGTRRQVERSVGQVVCVTCGKVAAWNAGIKVMHTGHFLASRRPSIVLEETNVAPQCAACNYYGKGTQGAFQQWMEFVHGQDEIDRLIQLKHQGGAFTCEELVRKWFEHSERLKAAEETMKGNA